jgi:hypothetical protein
MAGGLEPLGRLKALITSKGKKRAASFSDAALFRVEMAPRQERI